MPRTNFDPARHSFKFGNSFINNFISVLNVRTRGLCGGMVYSALDYFNAGMEIPQQSYAPAEGSPLRKYLYDRQVDSITRNIDKWLEYGVNPFGARDGEFFGWGLQLGNGRLRELCRFIDRGRPVPLGLSRGSSNHQVLAIGYDLGRYRGDLNVHSSDVSIYVYDPNQPEKTRTLKPDVRQGRYYFTDNRNVYWLAYFPDSKYTASRPPVISSVANELIVTFETGNDDLRGGNDNVNVILLRRGGMRDRRFNNVNKGSRWIDHSTNTISRALPASIKLEDLRGITLETTFSGGLFGDNWNLRSLKVEARINGQIHRLLDRSGRPLYRFTGDHLTRTFLFDSLASEFLLHTATALHETDDTFAFSLASNNDLFAIKKSKTGTHMTEVHVLSAASKYQKFILQTGTALHKTDASFEFALAPNRDLFAIKKSNTGTRSTEVHILSAASKYQKFILQTGTALHETDVAFEFALASNRDLVAIKKSRTGSRSTEVHILSAASNYQQFSLQTGTALHETDQSFSFDITASRDLFAIKKLNTATHTTEIYVADFP